MKAAGKLCNPYICTYLHGDPYKYKQIAQNIQFAQLARCFMSRTIVLHYRKNTYYVDLNGVYLRFRFRCFKAFSNYKSWSGFIFETIFPTQEAKFAVAFYVELIDI